MSELLTEQPYEARSDGVFLAEMNKLTQHHAAGCPDYARIVRTREAARTIEDLPFLHVGLFKHIEFKTNHDEVRSERTLLSSATTSGVSSRIVLDQRSSALQSRSSLAILKDFVGSERRPLLILEHPSALRQRGTVTARVAAAMSLRPLASELHFLLSDPNEPASVNWETVRSVAEEHSDLLVYGFTWILWTAWGTMELPIVARRALARTRIRFVHSGGWKKLEALKVDRQRFDAVLLTGLSPGSRVIDYYGMVEQNGVVYPLCEQGYRHPPRWADILVRDPYSRHSVVGQVGQLQLMNVLAFGAPYHSVLTEDLGVIVPGPCECGRSGKRFELRGRIPKSEVRGCANV